MKKIKTILIILAISLSGYYIFFRSNYFNNDEENIRIRGSFLDAAYAKSSDDEILWILTNGAKTYIKEVSRPGYHSVERKGIGKKMWLYKYSLSQKKILEQRKVPMDFIPDFIRFIQEDNKLFFLNMQVSNLFFLELDAFTGDTIETLKQFQQRFPILTAGIASIYKPPFGYPGPSTILIETSDGYSLLYSPRLDTLFKNARELTDAMDSLYQDKRIEFAMTYEPNSGSSVRKVLEKHEWEDQMFELWHFDGTKMIDIQHKTGFKNEIKTILDSTSVYIEGEIVYQDQESVVIFHDAGVGITEADCQRFLSCCNKEGKLLWKLNVINEISEKLKRTEDGLTSMFFMRDDIKVASSNDVLIICYPEKKGVIYILNRLTGEKIARLKL